jgi:LEA14-like dessication related protein
MIMQAKSIRSIIALLVVMVCAGLAQAGDDKKPSVKLKGIALKSFTLSNQTAETTVSIEIDNPGPEFKIKEASYHLKLNQRKAAAGKRDEEITVPAAGSITVELPVTVNLAELPGVTWATILDGLNVNYELETAFTVPVFALFNHKVKQSFNGDLPLGQMILSLPGMLKEQLFGKP